MGDITSMLISMGFPPNYIQRAFKVYEKNYGHSYNVEVITEIIVRLQNKDKAKKGNKTGDQDKSPQPPSSTAKDNKESPSKSFKTSPSKHSKSKPKTSQNDP